MIDVPRLAGLLVAGPFAAAARLRSARPLHPEGAVFDGVLERRGGRPPWGVGWLDEPGRDDVVVRLSRAVGLPEGVPDILGLAMRVPGRQEPIDLLLSTTGRGPAGRFLLAPRRDAAATYTSLMGYGSAAGTIRLAAFPASSGTPSEPAPAAAAVAARGLSFDLAAAVGLGSWRPFARLFLTTPTRPLDPDVRFDPVLNPPPGLAADGPVARFRRPAYASARAARP